jgi:hypothetical protein
MTPPIRTLDARLIDDLFDMSGGYVLDFSDRTFAAFFAEELDVEINDRKYFAEGSSKAKRLRYFLKISEVPMRIRVLRALWEYRSAFYRRTGAKDQIKNAETEFNSLIQRVGGSVGSGATAAPPIVAARPNADTFKVLHSKLLALTSLAPQRRGYQLEQFLKGVFDASGLAGRASFRVVGEQIDGSFEAFGEVYLLEAKWTALQANAADLRSFNGKVEDKAAWSRGLFVSNSGFTEEGLAAFGRGKPVACMDGLDLSDMLERQIAFPDVLMKKVRRAGETGHPFVRVRDLFP